MLPAEEFVEKVEEQPQVVPAYLKEKWSYSRLSTFERCERQFFHKYVEKRPTPPSAPMITGKIVHMALELSLQEGYQPQDAVRHAIYEMGGLPEGESYSKVVQMVDNVLYRLPTENVEIQSEVHLELKTTLGTIQGFIDIIIDDPVEDVFELWDAKSGWVEQDAEESKQVALYAWMLRELKGNTLSDRFIGRLVFPRIDRESVVILTDDDLEGAKLWFVRNVTQIKSKSQEREDWRMTKNKKACETCPFVDMCAAGMLENGLSASGNIGSADEAATMGEYILMQEQVIKNLKKGLKKYVEENDAVAIGENHWHISMSEPSPKLKDTHELVSYALKHDLDYFPLMSVDSDKLSEWLDQDESGILSQLVSWTNPRKSLKFGKMKKES